MILFPQRSATVMYLSQCSRTAIISAASRADIIIFLDHSTTGDGELSGAMLLSIMKRTGEKLSDLAKIMERYPQVLINVKVSNEGKLSFYTDKEVKAEINRVTEILGDTGRILVRVSGTEPLVRVMLEGENLEQIQTLAEEAAQVVRERLA